MTLDRARLTPRDHRKPRHIVHTATSCIQGAVSVITGIVTIAIIVIVWALFALHRPDILGAVSRRRSTAAVHRWTVRPKRRKLRPRRRDRLTRDGPHPLP
jgi:hypothetical protein